MNVGEKASKKEIKKERKGWKESRNERETKREKRTGSEAECIREECVRRARKKEGKQGKVLANECADFKEFLMNLFRKWMNEWMNK